MFIDFGRSELKDDDRPIHRRGLKNRPSDNIVNEQYALNTDKRKLELTNSVRLHETYCCEPLLALVYTIFRFPLLLLYMWWDLLGDDRRKRAAMMKTLTYYYR